MVVSGRVGLCGGISGSGLMWWYPESGFVWRYPVEWDGVVVSGELVGVAVSGEVGLVWWYPEEWAGVVVSVGVGWCGGI